MTTNNDPRREPLNTHGYPRELFELPENFITSPALRTLHSEVCARLLADQPDADMLDVLIIERTAAGYFYMRQWEQTGGEAIHPTTYKNMVRMWLDIATELRKKRLESMGEAAITEKVVNTVLEAMDTAVYGLDDRVAKTLRTRMAEALETV